MTRYVLLGDSGETGIKEKRNGNNVEPKTKKFIARAPFLGGVIFFVRGYDLRPCDAQSLKLLGQKLHMRRET